MREPKPEPQPEPAEETEPAPTGEFVPKSEADDPPFHEPDPLRNT